MEELPRKIKYKNELSAKEKALKNKIELQNKKILSMSVNDEKFIEEVSKMNSLTVDLKTVKSRIENLGVYHSGLETMKLIEVKL